MTGQSAPQQRVIVTPHVAGVSVLRALISLVETAGFVYGAVNAGLANGADMHHAIIAGFIAFCAHGVNHNAGGSPV